MCFKNTTEAYGLCAKALHWGMALLILGMLGIGFFMSALDSSPEKLQLYAQHKSFGILVLGLVILRIVWHFVSPPPQPLPSHKPMEKILAKIVKIVLYAAMLALPVSGWLMSSAAGYPASFFGLFELPSIVEKNKDISRLAKDIHEILAFVLIGASVLHMAGAYKHHFIDRDDTLRRMTVRGMGLIGGIVHLFVWGALFLSVIGVMVLSGLYYKPAPTTPPLSGDVKIQLEELSTEPVRAPMWEIDRTASRLGFTATQSGGDFTGVFNFDGHIAFDPANPQTGSANILIDLASIDTGDQERDSQALGSEWLNVAEHPAARFRVQRFKAVEDGSYVAQGILSLGGVTRQFNVPFDLRFEGQRAIVDGAANLDRILFRVGRGQWATDMTIGRKIRLHIHVEAMPKS